MNNMLVNIYHKVPFDVYIGRSGKGQDGYFGNPKEVSKGQQKEAAVASFKEYFLERISKDAEYKKRVGELRGKTLACFCVPKMCHGMVYIEYLYGISIEDQMNYLNPKKTESSHDMFE